LPRAARGRPRRRARRAARGVVTTRAQWREVDVNVEQLRKQASVESFVRAATDGRCERARRLLDARPEIASDPWARLVLGRGWDGDPTTPGGPLGWAPLLYVTHSCFASVDLARSLLERGADPNVTFHNEFGDMSAVYGAAGVVHNPELTLLLLEAGANPNDG